MKKKVLLNHLKKYGCVEFGKQHGSHAHFKNPSNGRYTVVPMHNDIFEGTAQNICKQLGIPKVKNN